MANKVVFGYWPVRGLGQVTRLVLDYTGTNWEDHHYKTREEWFDKDRTGLGLQFPNLPYVIDGDFKMTESNAINRYIINRSGKKDLLGKNAKDAATIDMIMGVFGDIRAAVGPLFYNPEWEKHKEAAFQKVKSKFQQLQKFIGNHDFFLGYLTIVDFQVAEFSHYIEKLSADQFKKWEFLGRVRKNFDNLPEIKSYYEKATALKGPFTSTYAAIQF